MAEVTPAKAIQDALLGILEDGAEDLAIDAREVKIFSHLPENGFTQKQTPVIVVERPTEDESGPWGRDYEKRVYGVPIVLVDVMGAKPGDKQRVIERLELLFEKVKALLAVEENAHLKLAGLHAFYSLCRWTGDEPQEGGNNQVFKPLVLSVPITIERGKILEA